MLTITNKNAVKVASTNVKIHSLWCS